MNRLLLVSLVTSLMLAADDPRSDLNRLQGSWRVASTEYDGKPAMAPEKVVWVFSGDDLLIKTAGRAKSRHRIGLGSAITPKAINRYFTTAMGGDSILVTQRGIYRLDGEILWICFGDVAEDQPTEFASKPGSRATLVKLKRGEK